MPQISGNININDTPAPIPMMQSCQSPMLMMASPHTGERETAQNISRLPFSNLTPYKTIIMLHKLKLKQKTDGAFGIYCQRDQHSRWPASSPLSWVHNRASADMLSGRRHSRTDALDSRGHPGLGRRRSVHYFSLDYNDHKWWWR